MMDWVVPGAVLAGKYALERKLGQGGMGAVWRAEHRELRSPVAIKLIDEQIAAHPEAVARFLREAQAAAALRSPHVVQILDFGTDRGVPYIAMELLEGESLAARLERVGRLPPAEVARIMTEVARAIGRAHELSIVHRDLKPDNIYLVHNDESEVTKVLDFGIAKATQGVGALSGSTTRTGAILGTPHYMSPEQAEGTKLVDHRTDLWALGVIAFECLAGRRPFESDALGSLLLGICTRPLPVPSAFGVTLPGFDAWFAKACARDVNERFQSARELATELRRLVENTGARGASLSDDPHGVFATTAAMRTPFVAVPPTAGAPALAAPSPQRKARALWVALGGAAMVLAGAVAVAFAVRRERPDPPPEPAALHASTATAGGASPQPPRVTPSATASIEQPKTATSGAASATTLVPSAARTSAAPGPLRSRPPLRKPPSPANSASPPAVARPSVNLGI